MKIEEKASALGIIWIALVACVFIGLVYFIHFNDPLANKITINILSLPFSGNVLQD